MITKSIVFTAPGRAELIGEPVREMGPKDVLVRLRRSSISAGTERANVAGEVNVGIRSHDTVAHFPRRSGYSAVGDVEAVGGEVRRCAVGDRVVVRWGCHSQYVCVGEDKVRRVESDRVTDQDAALAMIATFPLAALRKCRLELGEPALVMGQGVLGQLAVPLLRQAGAAPVIAADPVEGKRARALQLGADYALDPYAPDFAERVKELTGGGVHAAIEVTGVGAALDQALDCMAPMGRVALLGCTRHSDFTIDYYHKVHGPGISLIGAHTLARPQAESAPGLWTEDDDIAALLRLIGLGRLSLGALVQETHSPEEAPEIYARLVREKAFPVVQFDWRLLK